MKYIDKTKLQAPASYESELIAAQLDETSIAGGAHAGRSGKDLFKNEVKKLPSYRTMKHQLLEDQGYVCCYCNRRITGIKDPTEHVKPKSVYRELVGEYKNLLASCTGGNPIPAPYTRLTYPPHCDNNKANQELPISPLSTDCEWRFQYDPVTGEVKGDADVQTAVTCLNLNHPVLKTERQQEIATWCYDNNGNILNEEQLGKVFFKMLTREADGRFHNLYYIIASAALSLVG